MVRWNDFAEAFRAEEFGLTVLLVAVRWRAGLCLSSWFLGNRWFFWQTDEGKSAQLQAI